MVFYAQSTSTERETDRHTDRRGEIHKADKQPLEPGWTRETETASKHKTETETDSQTHRQKRRNTQS